MINVIDYPGPTLPLKPHFDSRIGNDSKEDGDRVVVTGLGGPAIVEEFLVSNSGR